MFFCIVWYSMYSMFDNFECRLKRKPFDVTSVEQLIEHVWSHMINLTGTCSFATPGQYIALRSNKVANCKSHECVFAIRESVPCENPSKVDYPIYTIHLDNQGLWFNTTKHNQLGIPLLCFEYKCQRSKYRITCQMYAGWLDVIDWCSSLYHPMSMCMYIYICCFLPYVVFLGGSYGGCILMHMLVAGRETLADHDISWRMADPCEQPIHLSDSPTVASPLTGKLTSACPFKTCGPATGRIAGILRLIRLISILNWGVPSECIASKSLKGRHLHPKWRWMASHKKVVWKHLQLPEPGSISGCQSKLWNSQSTIFQL